MCRFKRLFRVACFTALGALSTGSVSALTPAPVRPGDGVRTIYAVFIGEASAPYFAWRDARDMYLFLRDQRGAKAENLFVLLTSTVTPPEYPEIVDGLASQANIEAALAHCAASMDADDLFFWQIEAHGNGYIGRVPDDPANAAYHGWFGTKPRIALTAEDEPDYLERDLEFSALCTFGHKDGRDYHYGLNEWGVRWHPWTGGFMQRFKVMSHFTDVFVAGHGLLSDSDVYLERFTDYALGDLNKNGMMDPGENFDTDGDGILAYDASSKVFDEDEWGPLDGFEDDVQSYGWHSSLVGVPFMIFDANLDNRIDIDIDPGAVLQVDGTDFNNDGTIDGFDLDGDGKLTSWVSLDENVSIYWGLLTDDRLRDYLKAFTNGLKVVVTSTCMGGGFINDLSAPNTIIIAGSRELSEAPQSLVHDAFRRSFTTHAAQADVDGNGYVSFAEAFNMARIHPHFSCAPYMDRFQYDDNDDGLPHEGPLTASSLDGALGAKTYWEGAVPEILSLAVSPALFSPNADGVKDTTTITAAADKSVTWTITIRNASSQVVRTLAAGSGATLSQVWNGMNSAGAPVPDGIYTIEVAAANAGGLRVLRSLVVTTDRTKPQVTNLRDTPDPFRPSRGESAAIAFTLSEGGMLDVGIFNSSGVKVRSLFLATTALLTQNLSWNGRNDAGTLVPNATYTYRVKVTDAAGNASGVVQGTTTRK